MKNRPFRPVVDGTLAARVAPVVSNAGRYILDAAALAHFIQALDMSSGKLVNGFRQLERFSVAELSLNPIDSLNESTANRKVRLSHKKKSRQHGREILERIKQT